MAVLLTYTFWAIVRDILRNRYRTKIYDLIFIGGAGAAIGGLAVNLLAEMFRLENETPLFSRIISASVIGALWLPSMSTANNSLAKFKKREVEIQARLSSQDQLKFKQSMVFEFMTSSFYRSIQRKLSVTALEAREILDSHLMDSTSRSELPELVTRIATSTFRDLSHSIQSEFNVATHLGETEKATPLWMRARTSINLAAFFRSTPVLDPFPFALFISLFCAGSIARHTTLVMTCVSVSLVFLTNFVILKFFIYLELLGKINSKVLTITSVLATASIPPILISNFDQSHVLGFAFEGSNYYFLSYFVLALVVSFLGYTALLIRLTFREMEVSLQNQYREGVDKEQLITNEITRITNICAKYIHGNLQSSLITLSKNLEIAVANDEHAKVDEIIDQILELLRNPDLQLERIVGDIHEEVAKKCELWEGLVDIHPVINVDNADLPTQLVIQITDCVEELIANAVRHGKASAIEISIQRTPEGTLVLTCTDNGIFSGNPIGGLGFKIYQDASNGDWTISRTPEDHLTVVRILISS